jgi:hypothetical protein
MLPSIGRIVHFRVPDNRQNGDADIAPAIVTAVHGPESVNLAVFHNAPGASFHEAVPFGTDPGHWHWPAIEGGSIPFVPAAVAHADPATPEPESEPLTDDAPQPDAGDPS